MTTFSVKRRIDDALNKLGIQVRSREEAKQMAHDWHRQRRPELPENVAALPGYQSGSRASNYHQELEAAIQAAMSPDISKMATYINKNQKQPTNPLPAKDIVYASTPQSTSEIDQLATLKNNPATPTPEAREALFQDVPDVAESLVLWQPDPDATDRHVIVRKIDAPRSTLQIPAMPAEMLLLEVMRKDTHEQSTGENERLPEKHWML